MDERQNEQLHNGRIDAGDLSGFIGKALERLHRPVEVLKIVSWNALGRSTGKHGPGVDRDIDSLADMPAAAPEELRVQQVVILEQDEIHAPGFFDQEVRVAARPEVGLLAEVLDAWVAKTFNH